MAGFWETYAKLSSPPMYDLSGADPEALKGMGRTMLDSATIVGLGGEIEAGIRAPFSDKTFQEIDSEINQEQAAFKEKYPAEYTASSGLGMLPTIAVGAPAAITRVVGGKVLPNVAFGTGIGGLSGFVGGTGEGESAEQRIQTGKEEIAPMAVGTGVVTAAMMGAIKATPYIGKFLGNMAQKIINKPVATQAVPYNQLSAAKAENPDVAIKTDKYAPVFDAANRKYQGQTYDE
jgi:hypothetical protein